MKAKMFGVGAGFVAAVLAVGVGTARADDPAPVAGCGNGLSLVYSPYYEGLISSSTQGHVNGDGWVCLNRSGYDNSNGNFNLVIIVDNKVPLHES